MPKQLRVLWYSDSPLANTGFGVVSKNLIDNICSIMGHDIQIIVAGINETALEPIQYNPQTTVINGRVDRSGMEDPLCRGAFLDILKNDPDGYDGVFILHDFVIVDTLINEMKKFQQEKLKNNKKVFKSILYAPVDGYQPKELLEKISFFNLVVTYTEYGRGKIIEKRPDLRTKLKIASHGCNQKDFYRLPEDETKVFRAEFFKANADKIIFINVNRNQPRKAIQDTIFAFIEAKKNWSEKREPFLYLHMGMVDPMGFKLNLVLEQTDLVEGKDYMIAPDSFWEKKWGIPTETLNKIYNASDIYITTTLGEGWGLSVTEAMMVRLPVICPLHTSLTEITGKGTRAYTLENLYPCCLVTDNQIRQQTDIYETADVMIEAAHHLIEGADVQRQMLDNAEKYVKSLSWHGIAKQFVGYFEETF